MTEPTIHLRGMTWNHPRGYDPLVACSDAWRDKTGVSISWDKRSLQDFESYPVKTLAEQYDLIIIDHPHVGQIVGEQCLAPLDVPGREAERDAVARGSVGASFESYRWDGHLWAFPVDAATQVQAWQPDRIPTALTRWTDVVNLAAEGHVVIPLRPPHSLMCFYTLLGQTGAVINNAGPDLLSGDASRAYEALLAVAERVDPACYDMDPIAAFEAMAEANARFACVPLAYGYIPYSRQGFRPALLRFADIPLLDEAKPVGSALGGTGLAVSAYSQNKAAAIDFVYWVASAEVQRGPYAANGGQAGHAAAWEDPAVNAAVADFYTATRATLEGAYVRPRHDGYMPFQHDASERLNAGLRAGEPAAAVIADINTLFRRSFGA
jgi:multiple sugar transport system substrate-binding protein